MPLDRYLAGLRRRHGIVPGFDVPWPIHAPGVRTRAPRGAEIGSGIAELPELLARLPALLAVVLSGRAAARAGEVVRRFVDVPVLEMAHPGPVHVDADPAIAVRCRETPGTAAAASLRAGRGTPGSGTGAGPGGGS